MGLGTCRPSDFCEYAHYKVLRQGGGGFSQKGNSLFINIFTVCMSPSNPKVFGLLTTALVYIRGIVTVTGVMHYQTYWIG